MKLALGFALTALLAQGVEPRAESNEQRRARLVEECAHGERWRLKELDDYFLVTDLDDRKLLDELERRVELVRASVAALLDPQAKPNAGEPPAKTVLRVHARQDFYLASGGMAATHGLYFPERTEILLFSGLQSEGRVELFRMAQSLVACEMFDRELGGGAHAPWFQCGVQDYFAGFALRNGKLERKPNSIRLAQIRLAIGQGSYAPLKTLCEMNRAQYYGSNEFGLDAKYTWAEGWSLVWFLLTAEKTTHDGRAILERYLIRWNHDHDESLATAFAFEGVDWTVLEREWRAFVEKIR